MNSNLWLHCNFVKSKFVGHTGFIEHESDPSGTKVPQRPDKLYGWLLKFEAFSRYDSLKLLEKCI